jgi:hypothetical protein
LVVNRVHSDFLIIRGKKTSEVFGKTQCMMKAALEDFGSLLHFFEMIPRIDIYSTTKYMCKQETSARYISLDFLGISLLI